MPPSRRKHAHTACPFPPSASTLVNHLRPFLHQLSTYAISRGYQSLREFRDTLDVRVLDRSYVVQHCTHGQKQGWAITTHSDSVARDLMRWWNVEERSHCWVSRGIMTLFVPLSSRMRITRALTQRVYFFRALLCYHNPLTVANVLPFSVLDGRIWDGHSTVANKIHQRVVRSDWGLDIVAERRLMSSRISAKCNLRRREAHAIHYWMIRRALMHRVWRRVRAKAARHKRMRLR